MLLRRLLHIAFFVEVGLLLAVLPWSPFWERNYFAQVWPAVGALVRSNFTRGAISGLGVVNLFAGVAEILPVLAARSRRDEPLGEGADTEVRQ